MSMYRGPIAKMIDEAVEERMTALKDKEPVWSDWMETKREEVEGGTTVTEGRTGVIPGEKDDYSGEGGYAPDDVWNEWLQTPDGIAYTEKHSPKEVEEERTKFIANVPEKIKTKEVDKIEQVDRTEERKPSYLQTPVGQKSIMELFNVDPAKGGHLTEHAKSFFDTSYSTDNPVLDVLQDDKWMRKARKAYEKRNPSDRDRATMPFERWAMQLYVPKGQKQSLHKQAKIWEGDNAGDTDSSQFLLPDGTEAMDREITGAKDVAMSRRKKSNPFDRYTEMEREGGEKTPPPTNMKRMNTKPVSKMLQGRTMSFRKNKF